MLEIDLAEIEIIKGYNIDNFRDFLRMLLEQTGGPKAKQIAFLLPDGKIINERMLEDVNNLLNCGEVPNL